MRSWCVNSPVGSLYRGIPSKDTAVALAIDFCRYGITDHWYDDEPLERSDVSVTEESEDGRDYTPVVREHQHRGLGVFSEELCDHCGQPLPDASQP